MSSAAEAEAFLHELATNPPKGPIFYYTGPPLTSDFDGLLHPGETLSQLPLLKGINDYYHHYGERYSATGGHIEDGRFRSCNVTCSGIKITLLVETSDTTKFESFVRRRWSGGTCPQFVRHLSLFISPKMLRAERIRFKILRLGPGDGFVTDLKQYHWVANFTNCLAISINYTLPEEPALPDNLTACRECGLHPLKEAVQVPTPEANPAALQSRSGKGRTGKVTYASDTVAEGSGMNDRDGRQRKPRSAQPSSAASVPNPPKPTSRKRKAQAAADAAPLQPAITKRIKTVDVERLVDSVTSKEAVLRFLGLVTSSRDYDAPLRKQFGLPEDLSLRLKAVYILHRAIKGRKEVSQLYDILTKIELVRAADKITCRTDGRCRSDETKLQEVFKMFGWTDSRETRKKYQKIMEEPRKWDRILKPYNGIQCFLPFGEGDVSIRDYPRMLDQDNVIESFHRILGQKHHVQKLCEIGQHFLKCLWDCKDFPEHLWESRTAEELSQLDIKGLMRLLAPFQPIEDNISQTPRWPKPVGWPWAWPLKPDCVLDDVQCEVCSQNSCNCITTRFKSEFTEGRCGKKGRGLLAGAVFKKGEILGRLVGELVAPNTHADGWAFNLMRSDISSTGPPYAAQIYCRDKGNVFRLVNHACGDSASAYVQCERISGIYAPIFYARRDLKGGDEITVDWGEKYLERKDCWCDRCRP